MTAPEGRCPQCWAVAEKDAALAGHGRAEFCYIRVANLFHGLVLEGSGVRGAHRDEPYRL